MLVTRWEQRLGHLLAVRTRSVVRWLARLPVAMIVLSFGIAACGAEAGGESAAGSVGEVLRGTPSPDAPVRLSTVGLTATLDGVAQQEGFYEAVAPGPHMFDYEWSVDLDAAGCPACLDGTDVIVGSAVFIDQITEEPVEMTTGRAPVVEPGPVSTVSVAMPPVEVDLASGK